MGQPWRVESRVRAIAARVHGTDRSPAVYTSSGDAAPSLGLSWKRRACWLGVPVVVFVASKFGRKRAAKKFRKEPSIVLLPCQDEQRAYLFFFLPGNQTHFLL